jgi:hypothetical protein
MLDWFLGNSLSKFDQLPFQKAFMCNSETLHSQVFHSCLDDSLIFRAKTKTCTQKTKLLTSQVVTELTLKLFLPLNTSGFPKYSWMARMLVSKFG